MHPGYYMHPLHFAGRRFGLFPRLFWFGFGAFAASWWHKHHRNEGYLCSRRQPQVIQRADEPKEEWPSRSLPPPSYPPPPARAESESSESWPDKFDREKIRELGTQATDALADASEAMLESAFSTLEVLRKRLDEQRAARRKQQEAPRTEPEFPRPS